MRTFFNLVCQNLELRSRHYYYLVITLFTINSNTSDNTNILSTNMATIYFIHYRSHYNFEKINVCYAQSKCSILIYEEILLTEIVISNHTFSNKIT